jgi:hypothetical protein
VAGKPDLEPLPVDHPLWDCPCAWIRSRNDQIILSDPLYFHLLAEALFFGRGGAEQELYHDPARGDPG